MQSVSKVEGLEQHHIAALVSVAKQIDRPSDGISAYRIRTAMENAGFTKIATTLGLQALVDKGMLIRYQDEDYDGEIFTAFNVTELGMSWLSENQNKLVLKQEPPNPNDILF